MENSVAEDRRNQKLRNQKRLDEICWLNNKGVLTMNDC